MVRKKITGFCNTKSVTKEQKKNKRFGKEVIPGEKGIYIPYEKMIMHFRVAIEILNKLRSKLVLKQYDITLKKKKKKKIIISDTKNNKSVFK